MLCIKIKYNNVEMHKRQGEYMIRKNEVNINQFKEKLNLSKNLMQIPMFCLLFLVILKNVVLLFPHFPQSYPHY